MNTFNSLNLFTPVHWCARHGDTHILNSLLDKDAIAYTPDIFGFFPIDYAGQFKHIETAKIIIEHSILKFKELVEREKSKKGVVQDLVKPELS